ncbi:hypothetical protein ACFVT5_18895 [Streptomyces sp. NPDC058001]|uniref:hypothetical protein n=1 Tax=Streptomyces sp. NPDC058001 TaxID=3346300 RepID=UPI0036E705BA
MSVLCALGLVFLLLLRQLRSLGRHLAPLHAQPRTVTGGHRAALLAGTAVAAAAALVVLPVLDHDSSGDTRDRGRSAPTTVGDDRTVRPPAPGESTHRNDQGHPTAPGGLDSLNESDAPASSTTGTDDGSDRTGSSTAPGSTPAKPDPNAPGTGTGTGTGTGGNSTGAPEGGGNGGTSPRPPTHPTPPGTTPPPGTPEPPATTPPPGKGICIGLGLPPILDLGICLPR